MNCGRLMSNGVTHHFAVTAYSYLSDNEGSPFKTLESGEARVSVTPHSTNPVLWFTMKTVQMWKQP